ncbi:hypothetical protein SLS56_009059 [Neofusicoccum ribis]|uniref:Cytochrome P450 alkane hydroxylase n=1 Tax=Neofusicoccum ribis TaxID=45134 RepID=A0ABR3SIE1_9PEZI
MSIKAAKKHQLLPTLTQRHYDIGPTFSTLRLGSPSIITMEPANIKAILATRFKDFAIAPFRQPALHGFLGDGIFTTDGGHWAASRAMIRPNFARDQVADLEAFERHIADLFAVIPRDGATPFDLQELFFRFTIDSATEFLFGKSVNSLRLTQGEAAESRFAEAFTVAQAEGLDLIRLGPLARLVGAKAKVSDGERAVDVVHSYVDQFVDEAVRYREELELQGGAEKKEDEKYVFLHELAKQTKDKRRLRDELLNVLLAGRDTTASLLGNLFFVLSKRPDVWKKLRAEVEETLGGKPPTYEQLRNMKYLKWCMNESLRLHPVVPLNTRMCVADTVLPTGGGPTGTSPIFLKRGTITTYNIYAMHRRTDLYGADAEVFRPERWETLRVGWEYLPFNGGPRICVGQQYALTEAGYVTARLAQAFAEVESKDPEEWQEQVTLTLCSGRGCRVVLKPAA